jgi:hypothetical protein
MKLFLNYQNQSSANPNQVDGLYVYDVLEADVITMSWNGGIGTSPTWDVGLTRYVFTATTSNLGYFDIIINGLTIHYGYLSNYYGAWLHECGTGYITHIAGTSGLGATWGVDTAKIKFDGGTEIEAFAYLDGTGTKERQAAFISDVSFLSGATTSVELRIYTSGIYSYSGGYTSATATATCPVYEPVASITTETIDCTTTVINGVAVYATEGSEAYLYGGGILIATAIISGDFYKEFEFNPISLTELGGQTLEITLEDGGDSVFVTVANEGCFSIPEITEYNLCNKKCDYQMTLTGTADFVGQVAIYIGDELVAGGIADGANWVASSSAIESGHAYHAAGLRIDGVAGGTVTIDEEQSCTKTCVMCGTLSGTADFVTDGIITVYTYPVTGASAPIANGIIKDGIWSVKSPDILEDTDYVVYATTLVLDSIGELVEATTSTSSEIFNIPECCIACETPLITSELHVGDTIIPYLLNMPDSTPVELVGGILTGLTFNGVGIIEVPALTLGQVVQIQAIGTNCTASSETVVVVEVPEVCETCENDNCSISIRNIEVETVNGVFGNITKLDVKTDSKLNYKLDSGAWKSSWSEIGSFEIGSKHTLTIKNVANPSCNVTYPIEVYTTYVTSTVVPPVTGGGGTGGVGGATVYQMRGCLSGSTILVNQNFTGMLGQVVQTNLGTCGTIEGTTTGTATESIANVGFTSCGDCTGASTPVQNYVYSMTNCTGGITFVNTNLSVGTGAIIQTNYGICGVINGLVLGTATHSVANVGFTSCASCTGLAIPDPNTTPTPNPIPDPIVVPPNGNNPQPGCTSPTTVTVTPTSNPTVGSTVTYTATTSGGGQNYKNWLCTGGTIVSGQGTMSVTITWGTNTGLLRSGLSLAVGCSSSDYTVGSLLLTLQGVRVPINCVAPTTASISPISYPVKETTVSYTVTTGGGSQAYIFWICTGGTIVSGQGTATISVLWGNNMTAFACSLSVDIGCSGTNKVSKSETYTLQETAVVAPTGNFTCVRFVNNTGYPTSITYKEIGDAYAIPHTIYAGISVKCADYSTVPSTYGVLTSNLGTSCTSNGAC